MKPIFFSLTAVLAIGGLSLAEDVHTLDGRANVLLPFEDVRALLEAARPTPTPEPPPPVAAAVTLASVTLFLDGAKPSATAEFEVDVFDKGWQLVPLLNAPGTLAEVSSANTPIVPKDGMLCLLANAPGHFSVKLQFAIPSSMLRPGRIPFRFAPATAGTVRVSSVPAGTMILLESGTSVTSDPSVPVPAAGGEIAVRVTPDRTGIATKWNTDTKTVVRQRDDRLACESRIHLSAGAGSGTAATVGLPVAATNVVARGNDLREPEPVENHRLTLSWQTPDVLDREVLVHYDLPLPPSGIAWGIQVPSVENAASHRDTTAVLPLPGIRLSGKSGRAIENVDEAAPWIGPLAHGATIFLSDEASFSLDAQPLPRLRADTARIPQARFQSRIETDGARLCESHLVIQHRGALRWRFSLPPGSELLSCEVDGRSMNPLVLDDGRLELPIGRDAPSDADTTSKVALSFTSHGDKLAPVEGRLAERLPQTSLFIQDLEWILRLPEGYEPTAFEGNVEPSTPGQNGQLAFRKRLVRDEAAGIEIYYRKRDTSN